MMRNLFLFSVITLALNVSAHSDISMPPKNPKAQVTQPPSPNASGEYGDVKFKTEEAQAISNTYTEDEMLIKTTVTEVCPKKGCWMKVKSASSAEELRVTFKDYGFFVPTDLIGKDVVLKGHYSKHIESVDEQKHLLKDAKRPQAEIDAVTKPKETVRFIATGVKNMSLIKK